jgi:hypothetical protein
VTGSLINSPAFSTSNGGTLTLAQASAQRIDFIPTFTPNTTVITLWKNADATYNKDTGLPDATFAYGVKYAALGGTKNFTPIIANNAGLSATFFNAAVTPADITIFHQYACSVQSSGGNTIATNYLDGTGSIVTETKTLNRTGTSATGSAYLGWDRAVSDRYANGNLMAYLQYNRVLNASEIQQIYSIFRGRF